MGEGLLVLKVSVVEFLVSDDSGMEGCTICGAIDSKGAHCRGFLRGIRYGFRGALGVAGNHQPFFLCHNDLLEP